MKNTIALKGQVSLFDFIDTCTALAPTENIKATRPIKENLFDFLLKPEVVTTAVTNIINNNKTTSLKEEIEYNYGLMSVVHSLCSLPANDGNFISVLNSATIKNLEDAVYLLTKYSEGNKSRLSACTRKLKALKKGA